jgi:hypothetical protein
MAVLTNTGEEQVLRWLTGQTPVAPVLPYVVSLVTVAGTDTAAGTEATGAGYARQQYPVSVPAADTDGDFFVDNTATMRYDNLDAQTIVGCEVWDSATTPVRWATGALAANVAVAAGAPFEFAIGDLKWKMR